MADNSFGAESYREQWSIALQEELDAPCIWKDICRVEYTDTYILHNPYITDPSVTTGTRGCSYTYSSLTITDDDTTISNVRLVPQFIDRADMAQLGNYARVTELAKRQGVILNETLEAAVFAGAYAGGTDMGTETFTNTAGASAITVSSTNIGRTGAVITDTAQVAVGDVVVTELAENRRFESEVTRIRM